MINLNQTSRYGIMFSGGLDSAVLLYLILDTAQKNKITIPIQIFTIPKNDGSHLYVNNILKYFKNYFGLELPDITYVGDPNQHHTIQSREAVKEIFLKYPEVDFIYFATNQNPTHDFDYSKYSITEYPNRVKSSSHPKVLMPFINMYKDEILKFVFEYEQQELLMLTHTCTEQKTGRCGQCFQCNERAWAFRQVDKTDPGVN